MKKLPPPRSNFKLVGCTGNTMKLYYRCSLVGCDTPTLVAIKGTTRIELLQKFDMVFHGTEMLPAYMLHEVVDM